MAHVIAIAGKGGVGKTTLTGLIIQYLAEKGRGPILAVDADANSNLNEVLGMELEATLGDIREEVARAEMSKENPIPAGMKGCYCFVNGLLQAQLAKLQKNYPYIIVDNEAGMEHISRGVLPSMQTAILVSDCSRRGVQAVGRIAELIKECDMHPKQVGLIINRAPGGVLNAGTKEEIEKQGLTLLGIVPQDETVYDFDCDGTPIVKLPEDSPVRKAIRDIVDKLEL